ncbi:General stress protein A [Posidoniimonas corsicana]|uniref:General stress protein A n=1 Tax=Posidoniimonas corsicana TaxID=1938618 RepID=A0A5C5VHA2_9BACT|nr:glycosyltransferase family 8 protein [Posidoniimonas corsicana]TWT37105.1 General stress protein A [Posidoniimonas corsicana]
MLSATNNEVVAATGADEGYALPLAVTVRSAIDSLSADARLRLFIIDGGLSPETRDRLEASWQDPRVCIEWVDPDIGAVEHLPVSDHVSTTCYLRLMLPECLPGDIGKLIYFDADMLIRRDLTELYAEPLGDDLALAVQEMTAPWIDSELATADYPRRHPYLSAARPVANYRELGLRPEAMYFNSGLLVIDAARWRREDVGGRVFDCLEANRDHVLWWDQYGLNVVLSDQWRALDPRWNQTAGAFAYPSWRESPLGEEAFRNLRRDPWIVHYCSPTKPWHYFCDHPFRKDFYRAVRRTEWRDWRPERPEGVLPLGYEFYRQKLQREFKRVRASTIGRLRRAA